MGTARGTLVVVALAIGAAACVVQAEHPVAAPEVSSPSPTITTTALPASTTTTSRADAIREWESLAGAHFTESAAALEKISQSSSAEDEVGLQQGCQQLHDTNSLGLQADLPTPDRSLTNEIQQMIDDMNSATHACLRFALARNPVDADTYQDYLARAVEHLQRAKVLLTALKR